MQWQTPNSNTILSPLFSPQVVPTFATGSGSETPRKDSYCRVVAFVLLLSGPPFWRRWSTNAFWTAAKPSPRAPASTAKYTPESCRALADPQILISTTTLGGTQDSWSPTFLKLSVWGLESSSSFSPKELNWRFYHQEGDAVGSWSAQSFLKRHRGRGARSLFTDDNHYHKHKKKGSALLTAAKCSTWVGSAVINVTFTTGFATWKSIICFPGTYAWLSGELEAFTEV